MNSVSTVTNSSVLRRTHSCWSASVVVIRDGGGNLARGGRGIRGLYTVGPENAKVRTPPGLTACARIAGRPEGCRQAQTAADGDATTHSRRILSAIRWSPRGLTCRDRRGLSAGRFIVGTSHDARL